MKKSNAWIRVRLVSRAARLLSAGLLLSGACFAANAADAPAGAKASAAAPAKSAAPTVSVIKPEKLKEALDKAKGNVVVLNFWATFCPPCVKEMPEFDAFYKSHQGKGVVLLSANCDDATEVTSAVSVFLKEKKISFPVTLVDAGPDDISKVVGIKWEGNLPYTLVYDTTGKNVKTWEEDITAKDLSNVVDPLLPKKGPASTAVKAATPQH